MYYHVSAFGRIGRDSWPVALVSDDDDDDEEEGKGVCCLGPGFRHSPSLATGGHKSQTGAQKDTFRLIRSRGSKRR